MEGANELLLKGEIRMRIGVDVGGTFTDIVLIDDNTGKCDYTKTPTTTLNLWEGVLNGIEKILEKASADISEVDYIVHGTTIGTNALIEKKGAKTGLITTKGFIDVLEIGRVQRPDEALYNFFIDNPLPLVPRHLRKGVEERVDAKGNVLTELNEEEVRKVIEYFKLEQVESIAVCLLFSFKNSAHEKRIAEILEEMYPEAFISLSSEIVPEFREFERSSTTVINAYLQPIIKQYINRLRKEINERYGEIDLRIMQASGGTITAEEAEKKAINIVNSGPAGGILAAAYFGGVTGEDKHISADMGGTSFDIGLVDRGEAHVTSEAKFEGYPVRIPIIAIDTIGAGGGSIAWIDKGGALNVGPQSAGANPGPASYMRGGKQPTVTDANLILNRLNKDYFLGGEMTLDAELARNAINEHVAVPLGIPVEQAAAGIIEVANAKMGKGISVNSVEKGYDVREFVLIAFGGAGALHAVELAQELGMKKVLVPIMSGNLSAFGLLVSDARHDYVQTLNKTTEELNLNELLDLYKNMEDKGIRQLKKENFVKDDIKIAWSADLRYEGQSYEINVGVEHHLKEFTTIDVKKVGDRFNDLHQQLYSYSSKDEKIQWVNLRVTALGKTKEVKLAKEEIKSENGQEGYKGSREIYFKGKGFMEVPIYDRDLLTPGSTIKGPAVIEERIASTVIIPESECVLDAYKNLIVNLGGE